MSRPAHEVIIGEIRKTLEDLVGIGHINANYGLRSLGVASTLLGVLREIEVPEKERAELLVELQQTVRTWDVEMEFPDTIEEVQNAFAELYANLSRE